MMNAKTVLMTSFILAGAVWIGKAGPAHDMTPYMGSSEFQTIKGLAGHWEGISSDSPSDSKEPQKVTVDYHVTSGGSAVVETLGAGTPHEMTSIYADENGVLSLTHYCMLKNHPRMALKSSSKGMIALELAKDGGVDPKSAHMHSVTLDTSKPNQLTQTWTSYAEGRPMPSVVFTLTKKS